MPKTSGIPIKSVPALTDEIVGLDNSGTPQTSNFTFQSIVDGVSNNFPANSPLNSGWPMLGYAPTTITALGNRSYSLVFNSTDLTSYISNGMRLKLPRTVTAPTQCTSLNGTTQYYNKTSPAGMTFTDDFVVSAWVKLSSYAVGTIASRYNGTSGWQFQVDATGQLSLIGRNASASNYSFVQSYQSVPLNKWVHVSAQLDMSTFTATTTTSYVMIDGVNVPATVIRAGTNPTALVQAGNLEIGSTNGGTTFFPGKIAQVAIYSAKVTQATILASMNQTLTGSETSIVSAYTFNNSINDLSANANSLTPQGSAVATTVDSPMNATEYGIVMANSFSTNTTLTVQVPEGYSLPTSGGIGTVSYSTQKTPYGFPAQKNKWQLITFGKATETVTYSNNTWTQINGQQISLPVGEWEVGFAVTWGVNVASGVIHQVSLSTASSSESDPSWTDYFNFRDTTSTSAYRHRNNGYLSLSAVTPYYLVGNQADGASRSMTANNSVITANNAYL